MNEVNFIGCGRLGKTIAKLFQINHSAMVLGICNSSIESSINSVNFVGGGIPFESIDKLPPSDITFITTKDDDIQSVCEKLVQGNSLKLGSIIVHCSGSLSSDVLIKAKQAGCFIASIHPIKSFADPENSIKNFSGTYCGIEGDEQAISALTKIFTEIGGIVFNIKKEFKKRYHAAGVIANNYLVTLHYYAVECYKSAGVDEEIAKKVVSMLMNDAIRNINNSNHKKALTGPIQRGDIQTINNHVASLGDDENLKNLYSNLGKSTLVLTQHSKDKTEELEKIFNQKTIGLSKL